MPRSILNGIILLAGCAAGIAYGYHTQHADALASFYFRAPVEISTTPRSLSILGTIRAVNPLQKTLTLVMVSPYASQKTITMQAEYNNSTRLIGEKNESLHASQLQVGQTVAVLVARREGPLYVSSLTVLFQ